MKTNQGTVLIIVLIILTGLAAITAQLSQFVLYDYTLANLNKRTLQGKILAESGENLAIKLMQHNLTAEASTFSKKYKLEETALIWQNIMNSLQGEDFSIKIIDENSLFPINNIFSTTDNLRIQALYYQEILKNMIVNLMRQNGYIDTETGTYKKAEEMVNAILTWGRRENISEDDFKKYLTLPVPCLPPKRPLESPQELNLIVWPSSINETLLQAVLHGTEENKGLIDLITVWSNGPMNIIFLDPIIVKSLCDSQTQAKDFLQQILSIRNSKENINETAWYREIFERFSQDIPPQNILTHASRNFRFYIQIGTGNNKITMVSICTIYKNYIKWRYKNIQ